MPNPDSQEMIQAANRLAEEFRRTREDLTARLEKAEGNEKANRDALEEGRRVAHRLIGAIAVLALMLAAAVGTFAGLTHHQDDVRAANHQAGLARDTRLERQQAASLKKIALLQQQIVLFQQGACVEAADWGVYLDANPGSTRKSRDAAHRIAAAAAGLCSRTPAPKP